MLRDCGYIYLYIFLLFVSVLIFASVQSWLVAGYPGKVVLCNCVLPSVKQTGSHKLSLIKTFGKSTKYIHSFKCSPHRLIFSIKRFCKQRERNTDRQTDRQTDRKKESE